ncbi:MAG TPA: sigma-70 family RNA polymerase sigma factor [Polyangia bacterium]|nr:sigma-70 family RNA polymerase sigma factor [Polyangia bacterium]
MTAYDGGTFADFDALPQNDAVRRPPQQEQTTRSADFDLIYAGWFDRVLRWAGAMGMRNADKYDVAQNVFLVVMRRLRDFDRRNIAGWLYTITARQVKDYHQQVWNRRIFKTAEPATEELASSAPTPTASLEATERRELLQGVLGRLSYPMRNAMVLFHLHGLSCEEIAAMEGVSPNTIWTRLRTGRKKVVAMAARRKLREAPRKQTGRWRATNGRSGHA